MPTIAANGITMHYDRQGTGPPLILIPFLGADNSCYAFQVGDYARHLTCYSVDLRGPPDVDTLRGGAATGHPEFGTGGRRRLRARRDFRGSCDVQ